MYTKEHSPNAREELEDAPASLKRGSRLYTPPHRPLQQRAGRQHAGGDAVNGAVLLAVLGHTQGKVGHELLCGLCKQRVWHNKESWGMNSWGWRRRREQRSTYVHI